MTPEQLAARWLADVSPHKEQLDVWADELIADLAMRGGFEVQDYDERLAVLSDIKEKLALSADHCRDNALATIARHLAPGGDMVERAAKYPEILMGYSQGDMDGVMALISRQALHEGADTITALLARIAALTAQVAELQKATKSAEAVADNHWETLRSIRDIAKSSGDLARIVQWVDDAGAGYNETAEATLAAEMDRRIAAEDEAATLRARLARMEGALNAIDALDPEGRIGDCSVNAISGLVLRMGEIARAAITDGAADE